MDNTTAPPTVSQTTSYTPYTHSQQNRDGNQTLYSSSLISKSELLYALEACTSNLRIDGRTRKDIRPYIISGGNEKDCFLLSNASSRINLNGCASVDRTVSIKAEITSVEKLPNKKGIMEYNVDYASRGGTSTTADRRYCKELSEILDHLFGGADEDDILRNKLVVNGGDGCYTWKLFVDIFIASHDGIGRSTLLDVMSMAVYAALRYTKIPSVSVIKRPNDKDEFMLHGEENDGLVSIWDEDLSSSFPILITVCVLPPSIKNQWVLILDARMEEEECSVMKITMAVSRQGAICGVRTHHNDGTGGIPFVLLEEVMDLVKYGAEFVFREVLKEDNVYGMVVEDHWREGGDSQCLNGYFFIK